MSTIQITQEAIKHFRKRKSGKIITILSSYLANIPPSGLAVYVANKAYLAKLTQVWASENAKFNIVSNSVSPSFMLTGMTAETDERVVEQLISEHPLKKLLTVQEVAETVAFLVKDSGHINGVDIVMNAGVNLK
jgi:NAD(P)-dependent dehydrogenase (short-subunit alcohol dehydrogenase family)